MTYLGFLGLFLVVPLAVFGVIAAIDSRRGRRLSPLAGRALVVHAVLAVVYTTPWDNYLVASRVWWYDPARVLGITLGWVPLEEYVFFVLQSVLTALVLFAAARRWRPAGPELDRPAYRAFASTLAVLFWLGSVLALWLQWRPVTYLALILAWALPPIALQLAVGADVLWRHRRSALPVLAGMSLYLGAADALAIGSGVWIIDPAQTVGFLIGGVLPVEELLFFLATNTLLVFGLTLAMAPETWPRWLVLKAAFRRQASRRELA